MDAGLYAQHQVLLSPPRPSPALEPKTRQQQPSTGITGLSRCQAVVGTAVAPNPTLQAARTATGELTELERKKLPRYPIPCFRVGRLARNSGRMGAGLGAKLMAAKMQVGAYALLVDAKREKAKLFYLRYGCIACADLPNTLYLPLGPTKRAA